MADGETVHERHTCDIIFDAPISISRYWGWFPISEGYPQAKTGEMN
jgi:hypothetical protein